MRAAVFAYSRRSCVTARRVLACLGDGETQAYTVERFQEPGFLPIGRPGEAFYGPIFRWADAMIFVGACGIAVREIAPHIRDKRTDPAVLSIDELGRFVIPLLSGHIGGANDLALELAAALGATPVVTTATDINRKFSVDAWAARRGFVIDNMHTAKMVSAAILEHPVPLESDFPIVTDLPAGVVPGGGGEVGILISWEQRKPFDQTLRLIPPVLRLGIGCRRGIETAAIRAAVEAVFAAHRIDKRAVRSVASIDLKANEQGLLNYCREEGWPISFYSAEELAAVEGAFTPSEFVRGVTGVDNVCERAALLGTEKLIVNKAARNGVTVAVAAEHLEVRFE